MLKALTISGLAVVDQIDIEFAAGLTAITGETGAGKSVLLEALSLALGGRADSQLVRTGAERASVSVCFTPPDNKAVQGLLADLALESDNECLLRRVVPKAGASRAFCNATPVAAQTLRMLGEGLINIHSQHAARAILERKKQRELLDTFAKHPQQLEDVTSCYEHWQELEAQRKAIAEEMIEGSELDFLRYQLEEFKDINFETLDLDALETEHRRLNSLGELAEFNAALRELLEEGNNSAQEVIARAIELAQQIFNIDERAKGLVQALEQAQIGVSEAGREISSLGDQDFDAGARLSDIEKELEKLHGLARKHRVSMSDLEETQTQLLNRIDRVENRDRKLEKLDAACASARRKYRDAARLLSQSRLKAAAKLATQISSQMGELGMVKGRFRIDVNHDEALAAPHGSDSVEFLVSTNPDVAERSLAKVASGGEVSRLALLLYIASSDSDSVNTVIFDEVDSGVGGSTATQIGKHLLALARKVQVICITHSAQVAGVADQHLAVSKTTRKSETATTIVPLSTAARERELARMISGAETTETGLAHARTLLSG
ncbi:MAG: DNA repair protein RecN [Pseudomonadota bacterium]